MSSRDRFEGLTVENAINQIKQKHFKDMTAEDFAFLDARRAYLSEADIAIYLEGKNPSDVLADAAAPATAAERIIRENIPLQTTEKRVEEAKNAAAVAVAEASLPLTPEAKTEADKKEAEEREEKAKSLKKEAGQLAKDDTKTEKKTKEVKTPKVA